MKKLKQNVKSKKSTKNITHTEKQTFNLAHLLFLKRTNNIFCIDVDEETVDINDMDDFQHLT